MMLFVWVYSLKNFLAIHKLVYLLYIKMMGHFFIFFNSQLRDF